MKEALFYSKLGNKIIRCELCPHFCTIKEGEMGKCRARKNIAGKLFSLVYSQPCSIALDPIEKKPFYHFYPGSVTFSIATPGCNLSCKNCQNWQISQAEVKKIVTKEISPEEIIRICKESGSKIISFTYTEPTIFYEYMLDIAKLAKKEKIKCTMVSNGFINQKPLKKIIRYIDAFNIDLKSMDEEFYINNCGARLEPVLQTIKTIYKSAKHLEITNLLIPGMNDSEEQIKKLVLWTKENISNDVPLHFSAFFPQYKLLNVEKTPSEKVIQAKKIAESLGMMNVYAGNI